MIKRDYRVNTGGKIVVCKLRELMGARRNMRIQELSNITGLQRNTIASYYYNTATRYDAVTIAAFCSALDCTPGDLFALEDEIVK